MSIILRFYAQVGWEMLLTLKGLFGLHALKLKEAHKEGENIKTFVFEQPKHVKFEAGQYGVWFMPRWIWGKPVRLFTIAASPTEDTLQISTRISGTDFKKKLNVLPVGGKIFVLGPFGRFVLDEPLPKTAVLVAGGIGVTPMRAIAKEVFDTKMPIELKLIHSANSYYLYQDEFKKYIRSPQFVTKETLPQVLKDAVKANDSETPFYLSGPPAFVAFVAKTLKDLGHKNIHKDGFLGY